MYGRFAMMVVAMVAVCTVTSTAVAQQKCRGTKQWYAGKCRYPKDIQALKKQAAAKKAEEQRQQEEARRRAAEEKRKQAEAKKQADQSACELARVANTVAGWKTYLKNHADGACLDEAIKRITELSGKPPEPPPAQPDPVEPQPIEPAPVPDPVQPQPKSDGGGSSISPLVWIGFGVGGLGLLVGSITGGISFAQAQDLQEECGEECPSSRQGDVDTMLALAHTSTAMFVLAGVGTTLGVIGLFLGGSDGDGESATLDVRVGPGSVAVFGSF